MCLRITLAFPKKIEKSSLLDVLNDYGFSFKSVQNFYIINQLTTDEDYLQATENGCECNSGLNSYDIFIQNNEEKIQELSTYELRESIRKEEYEKKNSYKKDADKWECFLRTLILKYNVDRIGILIHFYSKELEVEEFDIQDKIIINVNEITTEYLMKMKRDILYYIIR